MFWLLSDFGTQLILLDLLRSSGLSPTSNKMAIDGARELVAGVRQGFTVQHIHKRIKAGSWNNGNGMRLLPETTLLGNGRLHAGTGKRYVDYTESDPDCFSHALVWASAAYVPALA